LGNGLIINVIFIFLFFILLIKTHNILSGCYIWYQSKSFENYFF